jgi:hypothetical protein
MAATSTSYNAAYVGAVRALTEGRAAVPNTYDIAVTAASFATRMQVLLANPTLSAPKQVLLGAICASMLGARYVAGTIANPTVAAIAAAYTTLSEPILDA